MPPAWETPTAVQVETVLRQGTPLQGTPMEGMRAAANVIQRAREEA